MLERDVSNDCFPQRLNLSLNLDFLTSLKVRKHSKNSQNCAGFNTLRPRGILRNNPCSHFILKTLEISQESYFSSISSVPETAEKAPYCPQSEESHTSSESSGFLVYVCEVS